MQSLSIPLDTDDETLRVEACLRKTDALQRAIFGSANFSCIATDAAGVIQIFNVGAERMLGYAASELVNLKTPADISDPEEILSRAETLSREVGARIAPGFDALVFKASRAIEDIYELTYLRKDGTRLPAVVSVTALRDGDEAIIGFLLIGTDNSARKLAETRRLELEEVVERTQQELESANCVRQEFIGNMAHELRTPLNAVIGFSELLRDSKGTEWTDRHREYVADIATSGLHLLSLVDDMLDLAKVQAGKMTLDLSQVDAEALFGNSFSVVKQKAATRDIRLGMTCKVSPPLIRVDARKVRQIVFNLLSNAVEFAGKGGAVELDIDCVSRARVGELEGEWAGRSFAVPENDFAEFIRIRVTDSGVGISPSGLQALFAPFCQVGRGLLRNYEGTGLGLALVKLLAELHGGTVAVQSAVARGACFTAWLPLRRVNEKSATGSPPAASRDERGSDAGLEQSFELHRGDGVTEVKPLGLVAVVCE